ncbi:MAG TPA: phosphonate ABC transporter ATP-binding protein [Chloroflexia bacterium]|nr:phosphonate ABC transporter ATP-binding protein [Chloroflexia bacterium]
MSLLRANNLRKLYPNGTRGLDSLSVTIEPGEMVGVLGSSGAGKTTFFRLLNGTLRPTSGELEVLGRRLDRHLTPAELRGLRTRVALISQHHNVIPPLSVLQNVLAGRLGRTGTLKALAGLFRVAETERLQAAEALALVGLADKLYARAEDLSGGQQQRVAIARAIVQGAELLLADEPIASVDMRNAALILDIFLRLNQEIGATVVMNLHQLDFAIRYCPRILVLKAGRLIYDGPPEGLKNIDIYGEKEPLVLEENEDHPALPPEALLMEEAEIGLKLGRQDTHD